MRNKGPWRPTVFTDDAAAEAAFSCLRFVLAEGETEAALLLCGTLQRWWEVIRFLQWLGTRGFETLLIHSSVSALLVGVCVFFGVGMLVR